MGITPVYGWPYPDLNSKPDGATQMKNMALAIEPTVKGLQDRIVFAASTTRPAVTAGLILFETDTNRMMVGISVAGTKYWAPMPGTLVFASRQTTAQALTDSVSTPLTLQVADYDPFQFWAAGSPSRVTPKIPGWYEFTAAISYASNSTGNRQSIWAKRGTGLLGSAVFIASGVTSVFTVVARPFPIYCDGTTDYVEVFATQTSGVTLNTAVTGASAQSGINAKYLGP